MNVQVKNLPLGPLQTNCYLLLKDKDCLVVDPGSEGKRLIKYIEKHELNVQAILLTHSHYDHIGAVDELREHFQIEAYIHENEDDWLGNPALNGSQAYGIPQKIKKADRFFTEDESCQIGSFTFDLLVTPGHSPGGVSFYFPEEKFVITGDALFQLSIGRTDLRQGNHPQLIQSIKEKLLTLADETVVLPGHGPASTIGDEKANNPFLQ